VSARHAAIEEEREKQEAMSQRKHERQARAELVKAVSDIAPPEVLSPPQESTIAAPVEDKQYEASFTVYATMDKLKALKAFLVDGGYRYESK